MYYIKSQKGYWLPKGYGYTDDKEKAGRFTYKDMHDLSLNLDGCTLLEAEPQQRELVKIEDETPTAWH